MLSLKQSLQEFDLGRIQALAEKAKANTHSLTVLEEVKYECGECKDEEGFIVKTDEGEVWRLCKCVEKKKIAKLIKASAITSEFKSKTFGNFELNVHEIIQEAYKVSYEYVKKFQEIRKSRNNSVAMIGRSGAGKTHLLMSISNNLLAKGIGVVYFPWVEGFNELKSDFDKLDERVTKIQSAEVLFIDDMWKGRKEPTPFQLEQAFAIVNYRYMNNLPILLSSEKGFAEMCEYDEAIGSRLKEMSKGNTVTIKGGIELNYRFKED